MFDAIPDWEAPMALSPEEKLAMLRDPAGRGRLFDASQRPSAVRHMGAIGIRK